MSRAPKVFSLRSRMRFACLVLLAILLILPTSGLLRMVQVPTVLADTTPQLLPFSQNWSNTGLITTDDNWAGVPGIIGYRGDDAAAGTGVDPQTVTQDLSGVVDVNANHNDPNTFITGGVTEFDGITNPVVALQGSGTADFPNLVITLNTTGQRNIRASYNLRDIDGSADNAVQAVALQYRVGNSGAYTNIPAAFVADASTGPSLATQATPVSVILPAACENQPLVQLRIITTNAVGNDEWIGVDDINVLVCTPPPPGMMAWWPGEGNGNDIRGENNGALQGTVTFPAAKVGQGFNLNGIDQYVNIPDTATLYPQAGSFTVDAWVKSSQTTGSQEIIAHYECANNCPANNSNSVYDLYLKNGKLEGEIRDTTGNSQILTGTTTVADGNFHHVAMQRDIAGGQLRLHLDGAVEASAALVATGVLKDDDGEADPITIGAIIQNNSAPGGAIGIDLFNGIIDEVEYFNRALSLSEIQSIFNAGAAGKCKPRCTAAPAGLVSWWDADDSPFDRSGTNHGTMPPSGAGFGTGKVGRAFTFDGSQNPVSIPDNPSLDPQTLTVDAWVFPVALDGAEDIIVNKEVAGTVQYEMSIKGSLSSGGSIPLGHLAIYIGGVSPLPNDDGGWVDGLGVVPLNTWSHVAMTFDGSTLNAYVNGVLTRQVTGLSGTVTSGAGPFRIGARNPGVGFATDPFNGSIDEVEFFNRALTPAEIGAINNAGFAGKCKSCLPVLNNTTLWWPGDGSTKETTGNGSNGTLQNGATFGVGKVGQAFSFNRTGDTGAYVEVPDNPIWHFASNDFTIGFWTRLDQIKNLMFIHQLNGAVAGGWEFNYQTGSSELFFNRDTNNAGIHRVWSPQINTWYYLTVTRTGGTYKLFVNGVQLGADQPDANPVATVSGPLRMGVFETVNTYNVIGLMDEVQIFNRALSQTEIQSLVTTGTSGMCKIGGTFVGPNTQSQAGDATLTFGNLTVNGAVNYQTLQTNQPGPMPFNYNSPLHVADISTTATFTGGVKVCFNLQAPEFDVPFTQLRILHLEGNELINRTTSSDPIARTLCANVNSLSPFVIAQNPNAPTAAPAFISGRVTTPDGSPLAGVSIMLSGARAGKVITDAGGNYRFNGLDVDNFYTVTPSILNFHFAPESSSFSLLANKTDAAFTGTPDAISRGNVIDTADYFVRQHYLDFLGREPDEAGFNFWSDQILSCGADAACRERRTINVSAAYFLSIEFQSTGGLVDGLYRASYGRAPRYAEFMPDAAIVGRDVVVGRPNWAETLEANKQAFLAAWVQRNDFRAAYDGIANDAYVTSLISHTAGFNGDQSALVNGLNSGSLSRAAVLRQIVENEGFVAAKRNKMFVMMEYFGYLRRDPDPSGYQFWLNKLNEFNGNYEQAEMVKAFIVSGEYRDRFPR